MKLWIKGKPDDPDYSSFMNYLVKKIKEQLLNECNYNRLKPAYDFIYNSPDLKSRFGRMPSLKSLFRACVSNITWTKQSNDYIIQIDNTAYIYGLSVSASSVAGLINFGNQVVPAYPIFDQVFRFFAYNLDGYYTLYRLRG